MGKGSKFEREISKELSSWWTEGQHDDYLWRSQTSGARATTRAKQGKKTAGQYGDIAATHPDAQPLVDVITFELKAGYSSRGVHDLLDRDEKASFQVWEDFISKAHKSHIDAGSLGWVIITKRTRRTTWLWCCWALVQKLRAVGCFLDVPCPNIRLEVNVRKNNTRKLSQAIDGVRVLGILFEDFLNIVTPKHIKKLHFLEC